MSYKHYRTCNLCEAMCGLEIQVHGSEILYIKGDQQDPFSQGHICPKALALKDIYLDPDRLKQPIRRTGNRWERIGWEEALEEVARRLLEVQEKHGKDAIGVYQGNPNIHNLGSMLFSPNFVRSLQTKNRYSATSVDQLPHHFAAHFMFGHPLLIPVPDLDRTDFLLIFGANPLVSNGSLMTAPNVAQRLKKIRSRGGKIVVIDPRKTETAKKADVHHFIQPGSDAFLMLAMVHTLLEEQLADLGTLADVCDGLEAIPPLVQEFSPEEVAERIGIPASEIRGLTRDFAAADRAVCYGRLGVSTQAFGGLCNWLVNLLNLLTGNLDQPGGAMFTQPAVDSVMMRGARKGKQRFGRWQSRVRGLPEFGGELPSSTMAEDILEPGEGQIKAMVTVAGNPVLSTPDGAGLDKAFSQLEFMVAIDIYLNETTRHADIILPPTTGLEVDHYDIGFHVFAIRNSAKYSPALFEKEEDQRHDWEIFQSLTEKISGKPHQPISAKQSLAFALSAGPYAKAGISLQRLEEEVHGVDLGPLRPCIRDRILTANGRIHLAPEEITRDMERIRRYQPSEKDGAFPFSLIGRRQLRSNNSWMHNSQRLVKGGDRCTALIHPADAQELGIGTGEEIRISSLVGSIQLKAQISPDIMQGVVSIPHGWGHGRKGIRLEVAQTQPGASINDLTDPSLLDELTGNAALSGVPVQIQKN